MGVPAFFRWLSRKYASIVVNCNEEKPRIVDGVKLPVDSSKPNPNDIEFDNLYLDMNGIIHPCCHPEDKPAPKNEDEMMVDIFAYIDRIFAIVRPRRLLYMAIDGVAPRAKMNQQRSRRFRAAKESIEQREEIAQIKEQLRAKGMDVLPDKKPEEHFDSNCITPGTPFMHRLAQCLRYYVHDRLNSDPGWKNVAVILSDANVPGEGEHKIMDFIRRQRAQPDHDPNTHHCLCGADADLIMLGLATHEPNFTIIREEFKPNQPRPCAVCGQMGHEMKECIGLPKDQKSEDAISKLYSEQEFIFLRLCILREYLEKELDIPNLPFKQDFERAIDDWVFMCFFVGNDFLPHLPSLEIREGAIDRLVRMYKTAVYKTGGYLTDSGRVNLTRVQLVLSELGEAEDQIFKKRRESDLDFKRRNKDRRKRAKMWSNSNAPKWIPGGQFAPQPIGSAGSVVQNPRQAVSEGRKDKGGDSSNTATGPGSGQTKRKADDVDSDDEPEPFDEVKLWEDGWKDRYYESKFNVGTADEDFRHLVANEYVLGLCWVLGYYYQGCPSWKWYFPYHYAPFASDFINIGDLNTDFEKDTQPFKPLEQLMGVFPAASKQFLPATWQTLMCHEESAIIDFYPTNFKIDLNGKKYAWQGVALLPFVDEGRLKETLSTVYPDLTEDEIRRNQRGSDRLVVGRHHPAHDFLEGLYEGSGTLEPSELNSSLINGMRGKIWSDKLVVLTGQTLTSPVPQLQDLKNNTAICIQFRDPQYDGDYVFPATVLPGAKFPSKVLKPEDFELAARGGRGGRGGRGRGRGGDRGRGWGGGRGGYRPQIGFTPDSGYRRSESKNISPLLRNIGAATYQQYKNPYESYEMYQTFAPAASMPYRAHIGRQSSGGGAPSLMAMGSYGGQDSYSGGYGGYGGGRYGNASGGRQDQTYNDRYGQRSYGGGGGGGGGGSGNYGQNVYGSYSSSSPWQQSSGSGYNQQYQSGQVYGSYSTGQGQSNQNYQRDGRNYGDRSQGYPRPPSRRY